MMKLLHQRVLRGFALAFLVLTATVSRAQLSLPTTGSSYTQTFDGIGNGLPAGWTVRTGATSGDGTLGTLVTTETVATSASGNFRNTQSADGGGTTDRALAVRQTGSFGDPGAAFQLEITNTTGKTGFLIAMKHQILDSQPRSTSWTVQYRVGSSGSWTNVTPVSPTTSATFNDPNSVSSTNATYSLPAAANDQGSSLFIRIVTLSATSGSGNRDTYGIDDFELSWTNTSNPPTINNQANTRTYGATTTYQIVASSPSAISAYAAPNLPAGATLNTTTGVISFDGTTPAGSYTTSITATNANGTSTAATLTIQVNKAAQTISNFSSAIGKVYGDADFELSATGGATGNPVTFSGNNAAVATVTGSTVHITGIGSVTLTATQAGNNNYNAATATRTLTVSKAGQTITFDAFTTPVTYGDATFELSATGGASGNAVTFTSSNPAIASITGTTVTITGAGTINITANQAGNTNYNAAGAVVRQLVVNPKELTLTGGEVSGRTYNGTTAAQITTAPVLDGIINSDVVSITGSGTASFASASAGTHIVTISGYTLTGANAGRYTLSLPYTGLTAAIAQKSVSITQGTITVNNKYYDGATTATLNDAAATLEGVLSGETVTLDNSAVNANFAAAEVGNNIAVTVTGYTLNGTTAANYILAQPTGLTGNILDASKEDQSVSFNEAAMTTTYGTPDFSPATATSGLQVSYTSSNETVATIVGNNIHIVSIGTAIITANQAGDANYNPAPAAIYELTVNPKTISVINLSVATKVYDGNDSAIATAELEGVIENDTVGFTIQNAVFEDKNAGENKLAVVEFILTGADAANYVLADDAPIVTGTITPKTITAAGAIAANRPYNGSTAATVSGGSLTGIVTGITPADVVTVSATGTFEDANVGTGKTVNLVYTLGGAQAANYHLASNTGTATANITAVSLTITGIDADDKTYDQTIAATLNGTPALNGFVSGDDVTINATAATAVFTNAVAGTNKPVTVSGYALTGEDAVNYTLTQPTGITADIIKKTITANISGVTVTKVYDAGLTASLTGITLNDVINGDVVTATAGTYATKDVATGIAVTITLSGAAAGNYTLTQPGLTGTITKKGLTAAADSNVTTAAVDAFNINTGTAIPSSYSIRYVGFAGTDSATNQGAAFTAPVASTTATSSAQAGAYQVSLTGGSATNYEFTQLTSGWLIVSPAASAETDIVYWDTNNSSNPLSGTFASTFTNTNVNDVAIQLNKGSFISSISTAATWGGGGGWETDASTNENYGFYFTITVDPGNNLNLTSLSTSIRRSASGPTGYTLYYALNGGNYVMIGTGTNSTNSGTTGGPNSHTLSGIAALQGLPSGTTIKFMIHPTGSTSGNYYITGGANSLRVKGTFVAAPVTPVVSSVLTDSSAFGSTDTYQIAATGTQQITFSAANLPTGASINTTGLISFNGTTPVGTYSIPVTATSYYGTDTKTLVYTVNKLNQVLTFNPDPIPVKMVGDAPFLLQYTNTASLPVNWSSSNTGVATINAAGNITIVGPGTITITASNTGNEIYNPVTATRTLTVRQFTVTPSPITNIHAYAGQPTTNLPVQLESITAANLSPAAGNITVTASAGFVVSTNNQTSYSTSGTIAYTGAAINITSPNIFVKLANGLTTGTYTGTLTFTGGGITYVVNLNGIVETAPSISVQSASYGPYCVDNSNSINVSYTTEGNFGAGEFYVQRSNALGVFSNGFSNLISSSVTATSGTITATLPAGLAPGNYRVRVIFSPEEGALVVSNDNGSDIVIDAIPTLNGVSTTAVCTDSNAIITLNGLVASKEFIVSYTVNGGAAQQATVMANTSGSGSFTMPVTYANNGQQVVVTTLARSVAPGCTQTFSTNNAATLLVNPAPAAVITEAPATVCEGSASTISLEGMIANSTSNISYTVDGNQDIIVAVVANAQGKGSFNVTLGSGSHTLEVVSLTRTDVAPNCFAVVNATTTVVVNAKPTAVISVSDSAICYGTSTQVNIAFTGAQPWNVTYNNGTADVTVNGIATNTYTFDITPLANTAYTLVALEDSNCQAVAGDLTGTAAVTVNQNTWTGAANNSNWNDAGNWSCGGVPTVGTPATIAASSFNPQVTVSNAMAKSLTINTGASVTIKPGATLTVQDAVAINGALAVENNAALIQVNDVDNTGIAVVTRNSNPLYRLDYTMWGSPVSGQQLLDFSEMTSTNPSRFYAYGLFSNGIQEGFVTADHTADFVPGSGYLIRMPNTDATPGYNAGSTALPYHGVFTGTPNNGDIEVETGNLSGHYIAVSNPYPSPISVKEFLEQNSGVLDSTTAIYFWRKKNDITGESSSYARLNLTGYNQNLGNEEGDIAGGGAGYYVSGSEDQWMISPGQGFIVKLRSGLNSAVDKIKFTNSMRIAAQLTNGNQPFFRTLNSNNTNDTPAASKWWINLRGSGDAFSQALVGYLPQATLGIDFGYDGKMFNDSSTKLYSKEAQENLGIQARPSFMDTDVVPMGFSVATPGQYTLSLNRMEGVFTQDQDIYIKDNLLGTVSNLKTADYTFTTDAGTFDTRFEVVYKPQGELGTSNPALENLVMVYQHNGIIHITSGNVEMTGLTLYDTNGRKLYEQTGINSTEASISNLSVAQQVLIVEINTVNGKVTKRIIY